MHAFNPSTQEAGAGRSLSSSPACSQSEFQDSQGSTKEPWLEKKNLWGNTDPELIISYGATTEDSTHSGPLPRQPSFGYPKGRKHSIKTHWHEWIETVQSLSGAV